MALVVKDRVQETTTTTGTGTVTLAGAVTGFQSFSVIGDGNTTYYSIAGGSEWELGIGTYTASGTTLSRDTVLESSNGGSLVNFSAGSKSVFCTYPAERSMYVDGTTITPATTATLPIISGGTGSNTAAFSGANITSLNASSFSSGTLAVARGGTGAATLDANNVILGNGTSAVQFVAPGTNGNVLTSNGTTWTSATPAAGSQGWQVLTSGTFSGTTSDTASFANSNGTYAMQAEMFITASSVTQTWGMRFSFDNGATFKSGANDYTTYINNFSVSNNIQLFVYENGSGSTNILRQYVMLYWICTDSAAYTPVFNGATFHSLNPNFSVPTTGSLAIYGNCRLFSKPTTIRVLRSTGNATLLSGSRYTIYKCGNLS